MLAAATTAFRGIGQFVGEGLAYSAGYDLPGAQLSIMGSGSALSLSAESPIGAIIEHDDASRDEPVFERTEDGADLSFIRFGAAYTIRISCANVQDPRCTGYTFLRSVADNLVIIGRSPR